MYEGDTPNAERRAAALALDRDLLRELLGQEELRELIDPEALEEVEAQLQHRTEAGRAGDRDALQQVLRNVGDLTAEECAERVAEGYSAASMLEKLVAERRVAAGPDRRRGALHRRRGRRHVPRRARRAAAAGPAGELPRGRRGPAGRPWCAATPAPTARSRPRSPPARYGIDPTPALRELERAGVLVRGELLPGGSEREWCDSDVLRRVRRASLAHLRREVEAAPRERFARFLPSWQNVDAHRAAGAGPDRLREALVPLQGVALTPKVWEQDVLPRRLGAYSPTWLDELCTSGEVVWIGAGARGRNDGRVALYFREDVRLAGPPPANAKLERVEGEAHDAIRERLAAGPDFWLDLLADLDLPRRGAPQRRSGTSPGRARSPTTPSRRCAPRACARSPRAERGGRRFARRRGAGGAAVQGRWSLVAPLFENAPAAGPAAARPGRADARALRHRHPRDGARRGHSRRLLDPLRRARQPRAARHRPPRLLRRGPRRRPVRASRRGRAAALAARRRRLLTCCWRRPTRPTPTAPRCPGRSARAAAARRGRPAPTSCCATASRSLYVERGGRGIVRLAELDGAELEAAMRALDRGGRRRPPAEARGRESSTGSR